MSLDERRSGARIAVGTVAALVLAYGILSGSILLSVIYALFPVFLYLLWRLVRALERLADAIEGSTSHGAERAPATHDTEA